MAKLLVLMMLVVVVIGGVFYHSELEKKEEREEQELISQIYDIAGLAMEDFQKFAQSDLVIELKDYIQRLNRALKDKVKFEIVEIKDDELVVKVKSPDFQALLKQYQNEEEILKQLEKNNYEIRERTIRIPYKMKDDHRVLEKSEDLFRSVYSGLESFFTSAWENIE